MKMSIENFNELSEGVRMKASVREAVMRILVSGETWEKACTETNVNPSVVKYAIGRINTPICKCCGQRIKEK